MKREQTSQGPVSRILCQERGAVLMIILVALVGLSALAAAGMMISETDLRVSENQAASANAFYAADAGLQEYLGTNKYGTETDTFTYAAGSTIVTSQKLLDLENYQVMYLIQSASNHSPPEGGTSSRLVNRVAMYNTGDFVVTAAIASGTGLHKNGGNGALNGYDQAPAGDSNCPDSPTPPVAGVSVPDSSWSKSGAGGKKVADGVPPIEYGGTGVETLESTHIPWDAIVNGTYFVPDYTLPTDSYPTSFPSSDWPAIYATGDLALGSSDSGQGILMVRGDLTLNGSFKWDGLILVGGVFTSDGFSTLQGAIVTGLNILLGETVADSDIGNGNKEIEYHSCNLKMAREAAFGALSEVPGTWTEDWN